MTLSLVAAVLMEEADTELEAGGDLPSRLTHPAGEGFRHDLKDSFSPEVTMGWTIEAASFSDNARPFPPAGGHAATILLRNVSLTAKFFCRELATPRMHSDRRDDGQGDAPLSQLIISFEKLLGSFGIALAFGLFLELKKEVRVVAAGAGMYKITLAGLHLRDANRICAMACHGILFRGHTSPVGSLMTAEAPCHMRR